MTRKRKVLAVGLAPYSFTAALEKGYEIALKAIKADPSHFGGHKWAGTNGNPRCLKLTHRRDPWNVG